MDDVKLKKVPIPSGYMKKKKLDEKTDKEMKALFLIWENDETPGKQSMGEYYQEHFWQWFLIPKDPKRAAWRGNSEWMRFVAYVRRWRLEEKAVEEYSVNEGTKIFDDDNIEEIQNKNRKRMVLILQAVLSDYAKHPKKMRDIKIAEIQRLYQSIQGLEEQKKRTELQAGKLKLDVVKTILPYQRMPLSALQELKEKINESFEQIIKLKEDGGEKPDGQPALGSG